MPDSLRSHGLQPAMSPLSLRFSRQEYWSGLPFPSPGDLPDPGIEPGLLHCRQILYQLSYEGDVICMLPQLKNIFENPVTVTTDMLRADSNFA